MVALAPGVRIAIALGLLGAFSAACSGGAEVPEPPPGTPPATTPPATTPPVIAPPPCEPGALPASINTTQGGRIQIDLPSTATSARSIRYSANAPTGWRVLSSADRIDVRVPYSALGDHTIEIVAACSNPTDEKRTAVAVRVEPLAFTTLYSGGPDDKSPGFRQLAEMFADPMDPERLLFFGGVGRGGAFGSDLWAFLPDKGEWTLIDEGSTNATLGLSRVAPVPGEPAFLLFGGFSQADYTTPFNLVRVDYGGEGVARQDVELAERPSTGSYGGAFVFDSARNRYITVGGSSDARIHSDVAAYDPVAHAWTSLDVSGDGGQLPDGRYGFAYGYDAETERLIVVSGGRTPVSEDDYVNAARDTWALELAETPPRWVKLAGEESPPGRRNPCFAIDPIGHRMFMWGGTPDARSIAPGVFALDLDRGFEGWQEVDARAVPPGRSSCATTYDSARHRIVFGFGNSSAEIFVDLHALAL